MFFLVEGSDDERFVQRVLKPVFEKIGYQINVWPYAQKTNKDVNRLIKSIDSMGAEYILFTDMNSAICVTQRKGKIQNKFSTCASSQVQVVVKTIESWYLAGVDVERCEQIKLPTFENTAQIAKEEFNRLIPKQMVRQDFLIELLKCFSFNIAISKNESFAYFTQKYNLLDFV